MGRLGKFSCYFERARDSICLDHHVTNTRYASANLVVADASSTCEVLYGQLDEAYIDRTVAECLYTGLIHDTGVFKYSCTSAKTMEIAGKLMEKGIDFGAIIDNSFYRKTYVQNQILGRALLESVTFMDGKCIFSAVRKKDMEFYGVDSKDLDGIIDQLRLTEGVECALFLYESGAQEYKVSMQMCIRDSYKVPIYLFGTKDELGHARGKEFRASVSVEDAGFAKSMAGLMNVNGGSVNESK